MASNEVFPLNIELFSDLPISKPLKTSLQSNGFVKMTPIQQQAIPYLLSGKNVLGAAPTGSGKTLSYLIPAIEMVTMTKATPSDGVIVIILAPSHELALQIYNVAETLTKGVLSVTIGGAVGGSGDFKQEAYRFNKKEPNLLIATPGRLRTHLEQNNIKAPHFQFLILDEADRMLEQGFADDLYTIFSKLIPPTQTALFSATLTPDVEGLMNLNLQSKPIFCCPTTEGPVGLEHFYAIVDTASRPAILAALLRKLSHLKTIVFVSVRKEAEFLGEVFSTMGISNQILRGGMAQEDRSLAFVQFSRNDVPVLICTGVGQRGLDFPGVDWVIVIGPSRQANEYVHKAGRTARYQNKGKTLLLLTENERSFVYELRRIHIKTKHVELKLDGVEAVKEEMYRAIHAGDTFVDLALEAVMSFEKFFDDKIKEQKKEKAKRAAKGEEELDGDTGYLPIDMQKLRESFGLPLQYE